MATPASAAPTAALVKDIRSGPGAGAPTNFTPVGNKTFFFAADAKHGRELWVTNGTRAGTHLVKDIVSGSGSGGMTSGDGFGNSNYWNGNTTAAVAGRLFFVAFDKTHGRELWVSNGTVAGTKRVKDIQSGGKGSAPAYLTSFAGKVYFQATTSAKGNELWSSNGTGTGTKLVKDINPGSGSSFPWSMTRMGNALYFVARGRLWKTDGTTAGAVLVKAIDPNETVGHLRIAGAVAGRLYIESSQLWTSGGTGAGTHPVPDIRVDTFYGFTELGGRAYFWAADDSVPTGMELFRSDGTRAGTQLVKDINPGPGGSYAPFPFVTASNGQVYFGALDGATGSELWASDGTDLGTHLVKDINPTPGTRNNSNPKELTDVAGTLFFVAYSPSLGNELWTSDGTEPGTYPVREINPAPGNQGSYPKYMTAAGSKLFFSADDGSHGRELWRADP